MRMQLLVQKKKNSQQLVYIAISRITFIFLVLYASIQTRLTINTLFNIIILLF